MIMQALMYFGITLRIYVFVRQRFNWQRFTISAGWVTKGFAHLEPTQW
jgi:hypothetical protein